MINTGQLWPGTGTEKQESGREGGREEGTEHSTAAHTECQPPSGLGVVDQLKSD